MSHTKRCHLVTVHYEEPTYQLHAGTGPRTYCWTFGIQARDPDEAVRQAKVLFDETARLSSVGWRREIVGVECMEVHAEA